MLYDDDAQLEVRHVVSLAHHDIDIYGGEEVLPEGELFVKRNCIRLKANKSSEDLVSKPKPYYLFTDDCSTKEDFYTALLQCKDHQSDDDTTHARTLFFQSAHLVKLIQQLHETEQSLQTRWLNALTGRIFLGIYRTKAVEQLIRTKLSRKISRVQKPAFLGDVEIQEVNMGDCIPIFTSPRLKELTLDGTLTLEADVKYTGNFKLQVATVARLDLGPRFKVREVKLLLAGILKELEGHMLLKVKPPPSNRIWVSFETMPKMNISVEPTVSSRHITYGIILRIIENRIREVVSETMVLPNWDDTPFFDTSDCDHRGGIFQENVKLSSLENTPDQETEDTKELPEIKSEQGKDLSDEVASSTIHGELTGGLKTTESLPDRASHTRSSLSTDEAGKVNEPSSSQSEISTAKPKVLRSRSFVSSSMPVVDIDAASAQAIKDQSPKGKADAATTMKEISSRARPLSPRTSLPESPLPRPDSISASSKESSFLDSESQGNTDSPSQSNFLQSSASTSQPESQPSTPGYREPSIAGSAKSESSSLSGVRERDTGKSPVRLSASSEKMQILNQSLNAASTTAKRWGLGVLNRQQASDTSNHGSGEPASSLRSATRSEPFGRGQPLPPPGTPLPFPPGHEKSKSAWPTMSLPTSPLNIAGMTRRKAVPSPSTLAKLSQQESGSSTSIKSASRSKRNERLSRQTSGENAKATESRQSDQDLIIAAPMAKSSKRGASSEQNDGKLDDSANDKDDLNTKTPKNNNNNNNDNDKDNDDDSDHEEDYDDDDNDDDSVRNRPALPARTTVRTNATPKTKEERTSTKPSTYAQPSARKPNTRKPKSLPVIEDTSINEPAMSEGSRKNKTNEKKKTQRDKKSAGASSGATRSSNSTDADANAGAVVDRTGSDSKTDKPSSAQDANKEEEEEEEKIADSDTLRILEGSLA